MNTFEGKRILVMGLGLHGGGLATTKWLVKHGARVTVTDMKTRKQLASALAQFSAKEKKSLTFVLGQHRHEDFSFADIVVQNPAVPRESPHLAIARRAGAAIENEATLFFKHCKSKNIIGITGTRGKSTTSAMVAAIVKAQERKNMKARRRVWFAGNIRTTAMLSIIDRVKQNDWVVLELSSWQLENMVEQGIAPHVSVVTNVLVDHLNRYGSLRSYAKAKEGIVRHQKKGDVAILNRDNAWTRAMAKKTIARVVWFEGTATQPHFDLRVLGEHNQENARAAFAVARAVGVPAPIARRALAAFRGLPDRLELVRTVRGVRYINDTTATTPDGTIAALRALSFEERVGVRSRSVSRIILILGGNDKKLIFRPLRPIIARTCKVLVFLPGTATEKMKSALGGPLSFEERAGVRSVVDAASMPEAVRKASKLAHRGDIVLLSPGATSFGLFVHEFDRGEKFRIAVRRLSL